MIFNMVGGSGGGGGGGAQDTVPVLGTDFTYTGNCTVIDDSDAVVGTQWRIKFLTSGTLTTSKDWLIDAFLVGGGGSGYAGTTPSSSGTPSSGTSMAGGRAGDGGYRYTARNLTLSGQAAHRIDVGGGGGGNSTILGHSSASGTRTTCSPGGGGAGGSGGINASGTKGYGGLPGGPEFDELGRDQYGDTGGGGGGGVYITTDISYPVGRGGAAGGSGGGNGGSGARFTARVSSSVPLATATNGITAYANTGGGGGGGGGGAHSSYLAGGGGAGGSGIVIIRKHKE